MTSRRKRRLAGAAAVVLALLGLGNPFSSSARTPAAVMGQEVVLRRAVAAGHRLEVADLAIARVPASALMPVQITDPKAVLGRIAAVSLPAGTALSAGLVLSERPPGTRDVAVRLDGVAGVPAGAAAGGMGDLYLSPRGGRPRTQLLVRDVLVVAASSEGGEASATLRVPVDAVAGLLEAEAAGTLRLVMRGEG